MGANTGSWLCAMWCMVLLMFTAAYSRREPSPQTDFGFYSPSEETLTELSDESIEDLKTTKFDYRYMHICYNETANKLYRVEGKEAQCKDGRVAVGKYNNAVNATGWGILEVETFDEFEPEVQAYAAGVVEGFLTRLQIYYHYRNTIENYCQNHTAYCKRLYSYLGANMDWIQSQVRERPKTDLYWRQVNLTYTQLTGIHDGYTKLDGYKPSVKYYVTSVLMLQLSGELFDLSKFLKRDPSVFDDPDPGKCSGLVKLTDGNNDLLMSHVAMSGYNTMNRVLKLYKFAYNKEETPGYGVSFSGYPGALASADDYTLTTAGLLSIETTISVFNKSLYTDTYIKPDGQLHCWVRSIVSNQLARNAKEWVDIFARYNSGTYNNQWTVLDYKLFKPGQELPTQDVLWVLEQIPGFTESRDVTWFLLKYRYWPSYNIPYLTQISQLSGFDNEANKNNWYRWGYCPRARIFHRDQHKVQDLETLKNLMRYNDYTHDEFSRCACNPPYSAEASISTRGDLNPANGTYEIPGMGHRNHGSLDYKGTNYELFKKLQFQAIGGPTYDPLPPFNWKTTDIDARHFGQPDLWKFSPFITEWESTIEANMALNDREELNESIDF